MRLAGRARAVRIEAFEQLMARWRSRRSPWPITFTVEATATRSGAWPGCLASTRGPAGRLAFWRMTRISVLNGPSGGAVVVFGDGQQRH